MWACVFLVGFGGFEVRDFGLMDRIALFLLDMRWKSWYLELVEHGLHLACGSSGSELRGWDEVALDLGRFVAGIAHRYDV